MMWLGVAILLGVLSWLGRRAMRAHSARQVLARQPEVIAFSRVPGDRWHDPATAEYLARPLRARGFIDLGVYDIHPLVAARLGVMLHEAEHVAAFLCEHPKALGVSLELSVRYLDGTTTMLINRLDRGVPVPPFFRVIHAGLETPSDALFDRLVRERAPAGITPITARDVIVEYQAAWARMVRWAQRRRA